MTSIPLSSLPEVVIFSLLEGESPQDTAVLKASNIIHDQLGRRNIHLASPQTVSTNPTLEGGHAIYVVGHGNSTGLNGTLLGGFWQIDPNEFIKAMEASWNGCLKKASEVYLVACDIGGNNIDEAMESYASNTARLLLSFGVVQKVIFPQGKVTVSQNVTAPSWLNAISH